MKKSVGAHNVGGLLSSLYLPLKYGFKIQKQNWYKRRIYRKYRPLFDKYKTRERSSQATEAPFPVWCCWWQGEENMPELVQICYRTIRRNAGDHPVHLITTQNYEQYVTFPDHIKEKAAKGYISLTHLSDILRFQLIYKYGGLWTDVTMLITRPLPSSFNHEFFTIKNSINSFSVTRHRWASFLMYGEKGNLLCEFMSDLYSEYWKNEDKIIHYLFLDYGIALAYDHIPAIRAMIDEVPFNNQEKDNIGYLIKKNKKFDARVFNELTRDTYLIKIPRKKNLLKRTGRGELTYYGYVAANF